MSVRDDRLRLRGVNTEREEGWRTLQWSRPDTLTLSSTSPLINHSKDAIETRGLHTEITHTHKHTRHAALSAPARPTCSPVGVSDTHQLRGVETWRCAVNRNRNSLKGSWQPGMDLLHL